MGAKTGDGATQVLFECSSDCPRVKDKSRRGIIFEGAIVPHGAPRTDWRAQIQPILDKGGYTLIGTCAFWRFNGANEALGNCCVRPVPAPSAHEIGG